MTSLTVRAGSKAFGTQVVLDGIDLEVPEGSLTTILGPSGSGKTTLLRSLAGFERLDRGEIELGGTVVDDGAGRFVPPEGRNIGYVPQEGALFPHLSVGKNVAFGLARGVRRSGRVSQLLEMVGLAGLARRYPHQLSGGQQQRVALARALAIEPGLVLLDEPFSSLDASLRASVRADVQDVLHRAGTTAVLVTHDQDEALSISDHVAIIRDGRIGQVASPQQLYSHPRDPDLARFLGEGNLIAGTVEGRSVRTDLGSLPLLEPLAEGAAVTALVRPEHLTLIRRPAGAYLRGTVTGYEFFGHDAVVRIRADHGGELVARVSGGAPWDPGTAVGITADGPVLAWAEADPAHPAPVRAGKNTPA